MWLLALIGLVPLVRHLGNTSPTALGLRRLPQGYKRILEGFFLGLAILGTVAVLDVAFGNRRWGLGCPGTELTVRLLKALLTAAAVSCMEEVLFRGALMGSLMRGGRIRTALLAGSVIYAWVHFFARVQWTGAVEWETGLRVLADMCSGLVDAQRLVPAFLNLLLAGVILGCCFAARGTLHLPVGLHAGWIFWLKAYGLVSVSAAKVELIDGRPPRLDEGWPACFVLTMALAGFIWWFRRQPTPLASPDALPRPGMEKLA
jgi:membrane protease YdiL (CAAX protease family)